MRTKIDIQFKDNQIISSIFESYVVNEMIGDKKISKNLAKFGKIIKVEEIQDSCDFCEEFCGNSWCSAEEIK